MQVALDNLDMTIDIPDDVDNLPSSDLGMTNFDHSIDDGLEEALTSSPNNMTAGYSGWNFYGLVWYDDKSKLFICRIKRYRCISGYLGAETLRDLMDEVCCNYGSD